MGEDLKLVAPIESQKDTLTNSENQLVRVEKTSEIDPNDVKELALAGAELTDINELQRGLERSIINSGLQVMADKYGADALLGAMQGSFNISEVVNKLAPSRQERADLLQAIKSESTEELADKFNESAGGVATTSETHDSLERHRSFGVDAIEKNKDTDEARELLSPALGKLLTDNPDIADRFKQTNDTITLLKDVRDVYERKYGEVSSGIEDAKAAIEEKIAEAEAEVVELQQITDEIYTDEITTLEQKLSIASSDAARELIQGMLDKKATEIQEARKAFGVQYGDIRQKTISDLGAGYIYTARLTEPERPQPTFRSSEPIAL